MNTRSLFVKVAQRFSIMLMLVFSLDALAIITSVVITSPSQDNMLFAPNTLVAFSGLATEDKNATISYSWELSSSGNNPYSTSQSFNYTIPADAQPNSIITATLTATSINGSSSAVRTLTVAKNVPGPTNVRINSPIIGTISPQGSQVVFSGSADKNPNDPYPATLTYTWVLTDGVNPQTTMLGQAVTYQINPNVPANTTISAQLFVTNSVNVLADTQPIRTIMVTSPTPPPLSANLIYVTNLLSDFVTIIDPSPNDIVGKLSVEGFYFGKDVSNDGKFAYFLYTSGGVRHGIVSVIDTDLNLVTATADVLNGPYGVAVTPNGQYSYATHFDLFGTVTVTDTSTNLVIASIPVGSYPFGIAITPDGNNAYVNNNFDGTVSVISTSGNTVTKTIKLNHYPYGIGNILPTTATPFSVFNVYSLMINQRYGTLSLSSNFTLGKGSVGIAPSLQTNALRIGNTLFAFPPGAFQQAFGSWYMVDWLFLGVHVNALIQPLGNGEYSLNFFASPMLFPSLNNQPLIVTLTLGNQSGSQLVYPTVTQ